MAKVDIRYLEKAFGDTRVLKGINLDIEYSRFVVLVGSSGCGKSRLLRVIEETGMKAIGKRFFPGRGAWQHDRRRGA